MARQTHPPGLSLSFRHRLVLRIPMLEAERHKGFVGGGEGGQVGGREEGGQEGGNEADIPSGRKNQGWWLWSATVVEGEGVEG